MNNSELRHSDQVAALDPEARLFYTDYLGRAGDSIQARLLAAELRRDQMNGSIPAPMRPALMLLMQALRGKWTPGLAQELELSDEDRENVRYEDNLQDLTAREKQARSDGNDDLAAQLQDSIDNARSPAEMNTHHRAEITVTRAKRLKRSLEKVEAELQAGRVFEIKHLAGKLGTKELAEIAYRSEVEPRLRAQLERKHNPM